METVEFAWLEGEPSLKDGLKRALGCSGQLIKKHFSSKEQDRVIRARDVSRLPLSFVNHNKINPTYSGPEVTVISEDANYLVVHKPPGVHCHPHSYEDQDTILNYLVSKNHWASLLVNEANYDRGLLYRLDYETSGVLILAKNEGTLKKVRENFETAMKKKFYWAIVDGDFAQEGEWTHYFKASGQKGQVQKVSKDRSPDAHEGHLAVKKIISQNGKSLVLVKLKTGLRHQIRAQLSFLGFPILGDELYGGSRAERLFLHAFRYEHETISEDSSAELFDVFFDLNRALQVSHDVLGRF